MKQCLIKCSDQDTIDKLVTAGFQMIENKNGVAVFINDADKKIKFDKSKVVFTNIMAMS